MVSKATKIMKPSSQIHRDEMNHILTVGWKFVPSSYDQTLQDQSKIQLHKYNKDFDWLSNLNNFEIVS